MKLRAIALGGVSALLLAAPAFAAEDYYNTNPTPAEREQTNALNSDAADTAAGAADANAAASDNYNAARSDYDRDRAKYDAERAAYDAERARYDHDRFSDGRYRHDHFDRAHRWEAFYGDGNRFRDVMGMDSSDLKGLRVSSRDGTRVGRIRDVDTDNDGRVVRVAIRTGDRRTAWIDSDDLRYDGDNQTVVTDLSSSQVDGMANMHNPRF
jgi:sporulation protein YlmC with PRC-barrel domain